MNRTFVKRWWHPPGWAWLTFQTWEFWDFHPWGQWWMRIWHCHHNARVIEQFESRMSGVLYTATGGKLSKAYYDERLMCSEIEQYLSDTYEEGYQDALKEHDVEDQRNSHEGKVENNG